MFVYVSWGKFSATLKMPIKMVCGCFQVLVVRIGVQLSLDTCMSWTTSESFHCSFPTAMFSYVRSVSSTLVICYLSSSSLAHSWS